MALQPRNCRNSPSRAGRLLPAAAWLVWLPASAAADDVPSFRNEVMAVLSKAGCNAGTCHGNASGKGGLKLSLRGDDPEADYRALTHDLSVRRLNPLDADRSLLLLKPTMQIAHGGGQRFRVGTAEYETLQRWIAAGMPPDPESTPRLVRLEATPRDRIVTQPLDRAQLTVEAEFSDGTRRDVTSLGLVTTTRTGELTVAVRFLDRQVPVRLAFIADRPEMTWDPPARNEIDRLVFARLRELRIEPSALCSDTVFLRRAYLDLLGVLPTAAEAREFVASDRPDKRAALVERLFQRPEFASLWALKWSDVLRNEERTLDRKGVENFHAWIRLHVAQNTPIDEFARELLAARGSTYAEPASNYYRALRDPVSRAESTAQVFLGVRLQCARCHNHPFDRWTQGDYYSWTSLFARVDYKILENRRRDDNDKHEFVGEQIVTMGGKEEIEHPRSGEVAAPRVLAGEPLPAEADRLAALAIWATAPDNPYFARAQVNRIWYHLLGRGIVDPVDDFRVTNPAVHPELLDWLAGDFVRNGFDLRHTLRTIMDSAVYQLSAVPSNSSADDETHFSRTIPRRLSAEQLADAMSQVCGVPLEFAGFPVGLRAGELPGVHAVRPRDQRPTVWDEFLVKFGKPPREQSCECERSDESTLSQSLQLIGGAPVVGLLSAPDNRLGRMLDTGLTNEQIVDELFWTVLSRAATEEERRAMTAHVDAHDNRRWAVEDVAWALMNSREFLFRQ